LNETPGVDSPVRFLRGVGPARAERLAKLGVATAGDLLYLFPRRYEDRRSLTPISELRPGSATSVLARVVSIERRSTRRKNLSLVNALLTDGSTLAEALWFNRRGIEKILVPGSEASFYGRIESKGARIQITNPEFELLEDEDRQYETGRIVPVYPLVEGLYQRWLRRTVRSALELFTDELLEWLPDFVLERFSFPPLADAMGSMHYPEGNDDWKEARKRFAFEELFVLQTGLAMRRRMRKREKGGRPLVFDGAEAKRFISAAVPFSLTESQQRVLREIESDAGGSEPMNRLLQGDVGSGKTVVAALFLLASVDAGYQGALMAPTEVLAKQHFDVFSRWFQGTGVKTALLTGSMPPSERETVLAGVRDGSVSLLVGTHALIQEKVEFCDLAAVVADEQHRFGVMQRNMLVSKGTLPHVLVMTATPIPRTLTLSVYGDLSVSVIDELPPGRIPVVTRSMKKPTKRFLDFLRAEMDAGRQAYWVCPLIEDSEKSDLASAVARFESLRSMFGPERVGLLHGRLSSSEKESVMMSFARGDIRLLVATTVIEVGIDVPDATVMVVENAHRFGLSQLHQLRGRVGRSKMKCYCVLLGDPGSPDGRSRLRVMTSTNDGFKIAEADLAMRGPGEVCGVRQHGVTDFLVADLRRDRRLLEEARKTAFDLVERDPLLKSCPGLLGEVLRRFGDRLSLAETA